MGVPALRRRPRCALFDRECAEASVMNLFTLIHVLISLAAVLSGLAVLAGLLAANRMPNVTLAFLAATVATSVTGFGFHRDHVLPSHVVGVVSLAALAAAILALYRFKLEGAWRWIYVAAAVAALYLNVFVLVVQAFRKLPPLHVLAPTGSEPPLAAVQVAVLVAFVGLGALAVRRFQPSSLAAIS
jgi:hypothetical protein